MRCCALANATSRKLTAADTRTITLMDCMALSPSDSRQERGPMSAVFQDKELSGNSPTYQTIREVGISVREVWFSFRKLIPPLNGCHRDRRVHRGGMYRQLTNRVRGGHHASPGDCLRPKKRPLWG